MPSLLEIQCEQETFQFVVDFCPLPAQKGSGRQCILSAPKGNLFNSKNVFFIVLDWQNYLLLHNT